MSLIIPKTQILYAPMLGSLGGGSVRGFGRGVGGGGITLIQSRSSSGVQTFSLGAGDYTLFLMGGGGGASTDNSGSYVGMGGSGGLFMFNITVSGNSDFEIGVGGKANNQGPSNSSSYSMRGGEGVQDTYWSGSGGGGSYLKVTSNQGNVVNESGYVAAVGGGGGGGHHDFTANVGGDGYGVGGGGYDNHWPGMPHAGKPGYDPNNGDYALAGDAQSSGSMGGYPNGTNLIGANGKPSQYGGTPGGAGGGGAGGGSGGAGGGSNRNGNHGGYIQVANSKRMLARGGGGGGSHGGACGGSGGGGGALLLTAHTPWFNNSNPNSVVAVLCPPQDTKTGQNASNFAHYNLIPEAERGIYQHFGRGASVNGPSRDGFALLYTGTVV